MTRTTWLPLTAPRLSPMDRSQISLSNDTLHLHYELMPDGQAAKTWTVVGARRIVEAQAHGLPLQGSRVMPAKTANAEIEALMVEARQLNHSLAAFRVVG